MTEAEQIVAKWLERQGYKLITRGWPDFMCIARGRWEQDQFRILCVEVKNGKDNLTHEQKLIHGLLKKAGIPVYVLRPESLKNRLRGTLIDSGNNYKALDLDLCELERRVTELRAKLDECEIAFDVSDADSFAPNSLFIESPLETLDKQ